MIDRPPGSGWLAAVHCLFAPLGCGFGATADLGYGFGYRILELMEVIGKRRKVMSSSWVIVEKRGKKAPSLPMRTLRRT